MSWYVASSDNLHRPFELKADEVIGVGRDPTTGIKDTNVSKLHILFKYQPGKNSVICKHLGKHPSLINGTMLSKGMKLKIGLDAAIHLLPNQYPYKIYDHNPSLRPVSLKRSLSTTPTKDPAKRKCVENSGLSSFVTSTIMEKVTESGGLWHVSRDLIVYTPPDVVAKPKVAAFDLDWCIIKTKSGKVFPTDHRDWEIMWPGKIIPKLKQLNESGYKLVFLTNQTGIARKKLSVTDWQEKASAVVKALGLPVQVIASPNYSLTRKPCPGMWYGLERYFNKGVTIDMDSSFYVGDAAGRPVNWAPKKKKDFSSSDRALAHNLGLTFHTPEEYFLNEKGVSMSWSSFSTAELDSSRGMLSGGAQLMSGQHEMIIMVGFPASGKSTFSRRQLSAYTRINRDELISWDKCKAKCKEALQKGESVVVDNTNPDLSSRERYIALAKEVQVPVRCFKMSTTMAHAQHNNRFRMFTNPGKVEVQGVVYNTFKSKFIEPSKEEGFSEVVDVNVVPEFTEGHLEKLYNMFLL